jgi:hypothetical protein
MAGAFLQGYRDQAANEQQGALSSMQQLTGVLSLKSHLDQQAQAEQARGALMASGGDANKAVEALIRTGNIDPIPKLTPLIKVQNDAAFAKSLEGLDMSNMTGDKARGLGMRASAGGHPIGPALMSFAENQDKREAAQAEHRGQMSTPTPIGATLQPGLNKAGVLADRAQIPEDTVSGDTNGPIPFESLPPLVQEQILAGNPRFAIGTGTSTNPDENTQQVGGLYSSLYTGPMAQQAAGAQFNLNPSNPLVNTPASQVANFNRLQTAAGQIENRVPRAITPVPPVQVMTDNDGTVWELKRGSTQWTKAITSDGKPMQGKINSNKPVPTPILKGFLENANAIRKVNSALIEVDLYPDAFGLQNLRGDTLSQRMDPKGVKARALIADIGSLKIHDRSGAAVTAAETPRLLPFIPSVNDNATTIKEKLGLFKKEYLAIQNDLSSMYSEDQGYKPLPPITQGGAEDNDPLGIRGK